jgi:peptidyl-prolyl cis-trans isomerase A (cyclophilin A)
MPAPVRTLPLALASVAAALFLAAACNSPPPEPPPAVKDPTPVKAVPSAVKPVQARPTPPAPVKKKITSLPVAAVKPSPDDPLAGKWTLTDATAGLPPGKTLMATIDTDLGTMQCRLFDDKAPITVANFVGLARGLRPWKTPEGPWAKKPAYDGTVFHRVVKGFMIQGGDAKKNGSGDAGYDLPDEIWEDANHDHAGQLCMANRGPNTNSAQFFITDGAAPYLDGKYTIFGECTPLDMIAKIASIPVKGDQAITPPVIKKITITRTNVAPATSAAAAAPPGGAPPGGGAAPAAPAVAVPPKPVSP